MWYSGTMETPEFSLNQMFLFFTCLVQLPVHIVVMIFDVPREIILFDTEVVVNVTARDNMDAHYIERVQNLRVDLAVYPLVIAISCGMAIYSVMCASVYQSGYVTGDGRDDANAGASMFTWGLMFWVIVSVVHVYVLGCVLNPVEFHFFAVVSFLMPLSVYRICTSAVAMNPHGYDVPSESRVVHSVYTSLDFLAFVMLCLTTLSTVRSVCRMTVLVCIIMLDLLTMVGHCYDGRDVHLATIFNCRFVVVGVYSVLSIVIVKWWQYVMFDIGINMRSL
jgi:hypothetical protein